MLRRCIQSHHHHQIQQNLTSKQLATSLHNFNGHELQIKHKPC